MLMLEMVVVVVGLVGWEVLVLVEAMVVVVLLLVLPGPVHGVSTFLLMLMAAVTAKVA